jgi:hypothetical protein
MNVILNPSQSNTRKGDRTLLASVDLTGKENYLLKIVNDGGVAKFALPTAITDMVPFVCASGDVAGNEVAAEAPSGNENCRVLVNGAVSPGDLLTLDPNAYGKLYKPAGGSGATVAWFVAEEAAAAGGLCLVRRIGPYPFTP